MSFQLIIFLYIYYVFLAIWGLFFLALIYHMFRFGLKGFMTYLLTFIFIAVAIMLLNASYIYIAQIDWSKTITIWGNVASPIL